MSESYYLNDTTLILVYLFIISRIRKESAGGGSKWYSLESKISEAEYSLSKETKIK